MSSPKHPLRIPRRLYHCPIALCVITPLVPHISNRLLEEQEREEQSKDESLRLLRTSGDTTDAASSQDSSRMGAVAAAGRVVERANKSRRNGDALGEIEMPQVLAAAAELEQIQHGSRQPSPNGGASESSFRDRFASIEDGGVNFEDEFDPILASIRKPPQQQQQQQQPAISTATTAPACGVGERKQDSFFPSPENDTAGRPTAGSTFAAGFLSMLPGDMRAKAGEVMAQSSARISESANAIRSALDSGGAAPPAADKRRQSDPAYRGGFSELEEGKGGISGSRRAAGGEGDEGEVQLLNVNDLFSEEEVRIMGSAYVWDGVRLSAFLTVCLSVCLVCS